jgi:hypothetical protein
MSVTIDPEEAKFAYSCLDDHRRLIAAGKAQRWDVTKWTIGINAGLATASIAIKQPPAAILLACFSLVVAGIGIYLVCVYTGRMTSTRNDAIRLLGFLTKAGIRCEDISGKDATSTRTWEHDRPEIKALIIAMLLSCVPPWIAGLSVVLLTQ